MTAPAACPGPTRRAAATAGLGLLGLSLPDLDRARATAPAAAPAGRARSCILLFLAGGPSQHDTWDPKPDAPAEVRGPAGTTATSVPGLRVGALMPRLAAQMDRWCAVRSVTTGDHSHASSVYQMFTGRPHAPPGTETVRPGPPNDWPHFGSGLRALREAARGPGGLPAFVTLPEIMMGNDFAVPLGQNAGFLGRAADPWLLACDPAAAGFRVPGLALPDDVPPPRLAERAALLGRLPGRVAAPAFDPHAARALDLVRAGGTGRAFELDREPAAVRDRYGRHKFGQSVLLARRLVEAGVSLVQVNWPREPGDMKTNNPLWDTHSAHDKRMKDVLMPQMDQTVSALADDLADRGLLDETLVVWAGEFGRTPRYNAQAGRDHWGGVFSVALTGGGVRGGQMIGRSDRLGAHPTEQAVRPAELGATVLHALGVPAGAEVRDPLGRPQTLAAGGVIRGVF